MPTQFTMITNGLGGLGSSYATIQDLDNLSLPRGGSQASITSSFYPSEPLALFGLTLRFQITLDGIVNIPITFTFPASYTTLDQAVAAFAVSGLIASNESGRFTIKTIKYGYTQGILLNKLGTANALLGFDDLEDTDARGIDSLTKEFTDDEKTYQLVMASAEVDGYISRRATLPLQAWDYKLIECVCDIAAFKLMFRQGYSPNAGSYDRNYEERYKSAIQWISDVGNRKIHPVWIYSHKPIPTATQGAQDPRRWAFAMGLDCCDRYSGWGGC